MSPMNSFVAGWGNAAMTSLGFFWMALWAFALGYLISSMIQVFVTRQRMKKTMGEAGPRSVALATVFGFISSSCSFAALATTKSLYAKRAGLIPSLAFLLASTNLVVELGIIIAIFLSWQFVVGEYLGGIILILIMWLLVKVTLPAWLDREAREHVDGARDEGDIPNWRKLIRSRRGWEMVASRYFMEWKMVWKDVVFGFTVAGAIAAFVPKRFFEALFIGTGQESLAWWQVVAQTVVGPVAAFFTFIGSMGNIPLASILYGSGVSFAGIMAFIFSDLVVFPVVRISARYFGWKMALYIVAVFLTCLVATALILHYGFALAGILPEGASGGGQRTSPDDRFAIDYTLVLNSIFVIMTCVFAWLAARAGSQGKSRGQSPAQDTSQKSDDDSDTGAGADWVDRTLLIAAVASIAWLAGGVAAYFLA